MKKLKVYFDTSVISHLDQRDAPEKMSETHKLWEKVKTGAFNVVLSNIVFEEMLDCTAEKQAVLMDYLVQIQYERVEVTADTLRIADKGRIAMNSIPKPEIGSDFTIDDIHKIREWHYECRKGMTRQEAIAHINRRGDEFE
ncbi:MAG: hypothetical protein LBR83_04325, partial [Clostridiales bacterium]|nr:hypothetical protein [Clostridiales bacterium]